MSATPWLKFYPTDWRSDPRLRMCSMAARGLWIDMLSLMHDAIPYGHLLVSGRSPTDAQLAVLVGAPSEQVSELLGELEAAGVFSRTREGVIYSRKMTRMQKKAATARNNGRRGGNPKLRKQTDNSASDNPKDKGEDKPQKLEARNQIKDNSDELSISYSSESVGQSNFGFSEEPPNPVRKTVNQKPKSPDRFQEFWDVYPHRPTGKEAKCKVREKYLRAVKSGVNECELIDAADRYSKTRQVADGYGRGPLRWFNERGWEDEINPNPKSPDNVHFHDFDGGSNDSAHETRDDRIMRHALEIRRARLAERNAADR